MSEKRRFHLVVVGDTVRACHAAMHRGLTSIKVIRPAKYGDTILEATGDLPTVVNWFGGRGDDPLLGPLLHYSELRASPAN